MLSQNNFRHFEEHERIRTRLIFILGAGLEPVWYFLTLKFYPEQTEYLWSRLAVSVIFLAYIPFLGRIARSHWRHDLFILPAAIAMAVQGLYMTLVNHWQGHHVLGTAAVLCITLTILRTKKAAWLFSFLVATSDAAICIFCTDRSQALLDFICLGSALIAGMFASYGRFEMINELAANEKVVNEQQQYIADSNKLRALGEMAGGIAHEINTPLATININAELIKRKLSEPKVDKAQIETSIDRIQKTVARIAKIIRGMREIVNSDKSDALESIPINDVIELIKDLSHQRLLREKVKLHVHCPENFELRCRPKQIAQLLLNLVNNSFDFLPQSNERWIKLEIRRGIKNAEIAVLDSGPGLNPEARERLWQPFFTTKPVGAGLGLGLSIAKRIAEDHGGSLEYEPEDGVTRFILHMPLKATAATVDENKKIA